MAQTTVERLQAITAQVFVATRRRVAGAIADSLIALELRDPRLPYQQLAAPKHELHFPSAIRLWTPQLPTAPLPKAGTIRTETSPAWMARQLQMTNWTTSTTARISTPTARGRPTRYRQTCREGQAYPMVRHSFRELPARPCRTRLFCRMTRNSSSAHRSRAASQVMRRAGGDPFLRHRRHSRKLPLSRNFPKASPAELSASRSSTLLQACGTIVTATSHRWRIRRKQLPTDLLLGSLVTN